MTVQLHDYFPGIAPNGLFWTVRIPDNALTRGPHGTVRLALDNFPVLDSFQIFGPVEVPATVSYDITWTPAGPVRHLDPGSSDPEDPTNLAAEFRTATAVGTFSGTSITMPGGGPFTFQGDASAVWAEMGTERNGSFVQHRHLK